MLNRLVDGPADVWTLRELTLHVDAVLSKTLSLLPRLTGLTRLTLHLDNLITVVSWPPLIGLKALTLLGDGTECPIWGSLLLAALAVAYPPPPREGMPVWRQVGGVPVLDGGGGSSAPEGAASADCG